MQESEKIAIAEILNSYQYDDYDRLIQLCDTLVDIKVVEMNKRMDDVASRYGYYPENKRKEQLKLKEYFEIKTKENIYIVVTENESLWGL